VISGIKRVSSEEEEIAFTFQEIAVTWNDGGITTKDDWKNH